jgi:quinol monooxygenase YgiN
MKLFPSGKQQPQMVEILKSVQDLTRRSLGCVCCWLSEEDYLNDHILYTEQWETEADLHKHIRSDIYRRVLAAMEMSKQTPEINFYYATEKKGFELVEAVRPKATLPRSSFDHDERAQQRTD